MEQIRTLIERREYVVDADKVATAILHRLLVDEDRHPETD